MRGREGQVAVVENGRISTAVASAAATTVTTVTTVHGRTVSRLLLLQLLLMLLLQLLLPRGAGDEARLERAQVVEIASETLVRHLWCELVALARKIKTLKRKKASAVAAQGVVADNQADFQEQAFSCSSKWNRRSVEGPQKVSKKSNSIKPPGRGGPHVVASQT